MAAIVVLGLVAVGGQAAMRLRRPLPSVAMHPVLGPTTTVAGEVSPSGWPRQGQAAVVVEGIGTVGVHGEAGAIPIGSVAKVMTALVVLRDHPLTGTEPGPWLTVAQADERAYAEARGTGDSLLRVVAGERISERQALEALMVPSADNVADLMARWDAGSTAAFVAKMNRLATAWGARHTHYADASGLSKETRSTATDQIRIGELALRQPVLATIMAERRATLPVEGSVTNYNRLLGSDGVVGIKTGSTRAAGGNLLFAARVSVDGQAVTIVGAVLGQAVGTPPLSALQVALSASRGLLRQTVAALRRTPVLTSGQVVARGVTAWGQHLTAHVVADLALLAFPGQVLQLRAHPCQVQAPAPAGRPCGSVQLVRGDDLSGRWTTTVPVELTGPVSEPTWTWRLRRAR